MKTACPGCGALLETTDGATHKYLGSSPACWAVYGMVLAQEYQDPAYMASHHYTVDAYALQHPGSPSPQTIQSAAVHLLSLYAVLELGSGHDFAVRTMQAAGERRWILRWLDPPTEPYEITVVEVAGAADAEEHARLVRKWAEHTWSRWAAHHAQVREWYGAIADFVRKD